jgi:signal transduction histidine kinase
MAASLFFLSVMVFALIGLFFMFRFTWDPYFFSLIFALTILIGTLVLLGFLFQHWANIESERDYLEFTVPYIWPKKREYFKPLIIFLLRNSIENISFFFDNGTIRFEDMKLRLRREFGTEWFMPRVTIKLYLFTDYQTMRLYIWPKQSINAHHIKNALYHNIVRTFQQNGFKVIRL